MLNWLVTNKQWVFDGFGVTLVILIFTWGRRFFKRKEQTLVTVREEIAFSAPQQEAAKTSYFWTFLEKVPGFRAISWQHIYTEHEISRRIRVTVRSHGDGIVFWRDGDAGRGSVWLDFINLNPFPLTIDKITGHITVAESHIAEVKIIDTHVISATAWAEMHFAITFNPAEIESIEFQLRNRSDVSAGAILRIYVSTSVRDFTLHAITLTGNRSFKNFTAK